MEEKRKIDAEPLLQAAVEKLKGLPKDQQKEGCRGFEKQYGDLGPELRKRLGLIKPKSKAKVVAATVKSDKITGKVEFHETDRIQQQRPVTIEERNKALEELVDLWEADPFEYSKKRKDLAAKLGETLEVVDHAIRMTRDRLPKEGADSQASKLMAVGFNVRLWHSTEATGYASIHRDGHWEHYRIAGRAFDRWLRNEFGAKNQIKVGERWIPQVPGAQAMRDAIASLESIALQQEHEPQKVGMRVGGGSEVIWIDLGRKDWSAVKVTREGWDIVKEGAKVPLIRTGVMQPLPIPEKGGDIKMIGRLLNVLPDQLVLIPGWWLQALNPVGDI
jgi:hypothetical protein